MTFAAAEQQLPSDKLSRRNFERLAGYIFQVSGIKMPPSKATMLEGRLRRRLRATGHTSFDDYCDYIFDQNGIETEDVHLLDAVTTNKTDFFREPRHFAYMQEVALPAIAARGVRHIRAWSAACSTGAEPYTMAMVLDDFSKSRNDFQYSILATDLCTEVLGVGVRGVYAEEMVAPIPADFSRRYIMRSKRRESREVRVHPKLRARVAFARMNLMDEQYRIGDALDFIFCRNVLIYFDKPTQAKVLNRLCDCLAPNGYLFVGHSKSTAGFALPVKQVANTIFQRQTR